MLRHCFPLSEVTQYPCIVVNTQVIYLDQDQEADLLLTGFVSQNDFSFRLVLKSRCPEDLKDIAPQQCSMASGIPNYYLLNN